MAFQRGGTPRRRKTWIEGPGGLAGLSFSGTASQIFAGTPEPGAGNTVLRIRGRVKVWLASAVSAGDGYAGAFAIGINDVSAVGIGATATPGPSTEPEEDWLFWSPVQLFAEVAAGVSGNGATFLDYEVDTKAMRKLREGDTLWAGLELTETGDSTAVALCRTRVLLAQP